MKIKNIAFISESHNNGYDRYWYAIDKDDFEDYMSSYAQDTSLLYHIHDADNDKKYYNKILQNDGVLEQHITKNVFILPWGRVTIPCDQVTVKRRNFDKKLAEIAYEKGVVFLFTSLSFAPFICLVFLIFPSLFFFFAFGTHYSTRSRRSNAFR